jgi:hypothetical protein
MFDAFNFTFALKGGAIGKCNDNLHRITSEDCGARNLKRR